MWKVGCKKGKLISSLGNLSIFLKKRSLLKLTYYRLKNMKKIFNWSEYFAEKKNFLKREKRNKKYSLDYIVSRQST